MDRDQVLRLLREREAACQAELVRLEQEAARIAELIGGCRRESERLVTAREVVAGLLVADPGVRVAGPATERGRLSDVDGSTERVLAVLAERGPVRCRDVVAAFGEDPSVARHVERVRHRLKKLVAAGRVVQPGVFTLAGGSDPPPG